MKSLCLVLGFTLLLAAACGMTLIGDGGAAPAEGLSGHVCTIGRPRRLPSLRWLDLFSIPAGNCPAACRCHDLPVSSLRSAARNLRCIKAQDAI